MTKSKGLINVSDSIKFKSINTGGQSVGNGGDGSFKGSISNSPTHQVRSIQQGERLERRRQDRRSRQSKSILGRRRRRRDGLEVLKGLRRRRLVERRSDSKSGYDTSKVYADTTAHQSNYLKADQHQEVVAGIGGDGGSDNPVLGGDVSFDFDTSL